MIVSASCVLCVRARVWARDNWCSSSVQLCSCGLARVASADTGLRPRSRAPPRAGGGAARAGSPPSLGRPRRAPLLQELLNVHSSPWFEQVTRHTRTPRTQPGRHTHRTFDHELLPGPRDGSCASPRSPSLLSPWCVASGRSCQHDRAPQVQRQLLLLSGGSARLLDHRVDSGARILGFRHTCLHVF